MNSKKLMSMFVILASMAVFSSCQTGESSGSHEIEVSGNEGGSKALNEHEGYELQKAVNRCHRTGGTRVVKIKGELKCY